MVVQRKVFNILLLGQTGAGKSAFINGFCNYANFENIDEALISTRIQYAVPTAFNWCDEQYNNHYITVGLHEDENEYQDIGKSATQSVRSYLFEIENIAIRIIDTPGFGDTEGHEKDEDICSKLFRFLSIRKEIVELHGIVFIFKPQENRMTTFFIYCMDQILSKLHKDACQNIIFLFTHTKGTHYKPGPTLGLLKKVINNIPLITIPCTKENIFCVENDCIQFLLAYFYHRQQLNITDDRKAQYETPWERSSNEYIRLLKYVRNLEPHAMEDTLRINSFRHYCVNIQQILAKILEKISAIIAECVAYETDIKECEGKFDRLSKILYKETIINRESIHYNVVCCNPNCTSRDGDNRNICYENYGAWKWLFFWKTVCPICHCNILDHVRQPIEAHEVQREKDRGISGNMDTMQKRINRIKLILYEQRLKIKKCDAEKARIQYWAREFSRYLQEESILSDQRQYQNSHSSDHVNKIDEQNRSTTIDEILSDLLHTYEKMEIAGEYLKDLFDEANIEIPYEKVYFVEPEGKWMEITEAN